MNATVRAVAFYVTTTAPAVGLSFVSTTVVSLALAKISAAASAAAVTRLDVFRSTVFTGRFFLLFVPPARRTLALACLGAACLTAILRAGLATALHRFEPLLRGATRVFALTMALSGHAFRRHCDLKARELCCR